MRKICSFLMVSLLAIACTFIDVDARTYTKDDVEASLAIVLDRWDSPAPEGASFTYESTANSTVIKSTFSGNTYETIFTYDNGVYRFTSIYANNEVVDQNDIVKLTFENFNISCLMFAIDQMYDEDTVKEVAGVQVGDARNQIDKFTLSNDGLEAVVVSLGEPIEINGQAVSVGFIKTMAFNLNHQKFIKWVTDNDGLLEIGNKKPSVVDDSKDVVDFEVIINNGNPIPEGTPREDVPIKIIEKYKDGTTGEKESTIGKVQDELGYKVDDFYTDKAGNFIATVTRTTPNSDGSLPNAKKSNYTISSKKVIVDDGKKPSTTENPPTGIVSHIAFVLIVVTASVSGMFLLKKSEVFKRF